MRTRTVEMFVGLYEGDAKTWYEREVQIPATTPRHLIEAVAVQTLAQEFQDADVFIAFFGVMHTWTTMNSMAPGRRLRKHRPATRRHQSRTRLQVLRSAC